MQIIRMNSMLMRRTSGFTLMELLLALVIMAVVISSAYLTFSTVSVAWRRSQAMSENLHHGDFVMEQVVMALRSSYCPSTGPDPAYGFRLENNGDGSGSWDALSWVKVGPALVGAGESFGEGPHRLILSGESVDSAEGITVRSWGLLEELEDFDADSIEPELVSAYITGLNCRCRDPEMDEDAEEIEWLDDWEDTNRIPLSVELTLYIEPVETGREALEVRRIVDIPVAPLSWQRRAATGQRSESDAESSQSRLRQSTGQRANPGAGDGPGRAAAPPTQGGMSVNPGGNRR